MQQRKKDLEHFFLVGSSIEKSLSPVMHNAALRKLGISGIYEFRQIPEKEFDSEMKLIRGQAGLVGFNVTTPYKERVLFYLRRMDSRSRVIGAVNTVKIMPDGKMAGYNTDVDGILISLKRLNVTSKFSSVILGAGGAARACAYALLKNGCSSLVLINRTRSRASKIRAQFSERFPNAEMRIAVLSRKNIEKEIKNCDLLVNAIANPFPIEFGFENARAGMKFFDLWYGKPSTPLLRARKSGIKSVDGFPMLVEQAARSLELWTGKRAPRKIMYEAGQRELSRQASFGSV